MERYIVNKQSLSVGVYEDVTQHPYIGHIIVYTADDMADLAGRVLPYVDRYFLYADDKKTLAELEQIAGK